MKLINKVVITFTFLIANFTSCVENKTRTIEGYANSNIKYEIENTIGNLKIESGSVVQLLISSYNNNDSLHFKYDNSKPIYLKVDSDLGSFYDILIQAHENSIIKIDLEKIDGFFEHKDRHLYHQLSSITSPYKLEIKVKKVFDKNHIEANQYLLSQTKEEIELINIHNYLVKNDLKSKELPSGVHIVFLNQRGKQRIKNGDKVSVYYAGMFLDNTIFDTNIEAKSKAVGLNPLIEDYSTLDFVVGESEVIQGMDEALQYLYYGDHILLIVPSRHAYGKRGEKGLIPPNSTLVFELEILKN